MNTTIKPNPTGHRRRELKPKPMEVVYRGKAQKADSEFQRHFYLYRWNGKGYDQSTSPTIEDGMVFNPYLWGYVQKAELRYSERMNELLPLDTFDELEDEYQNYQ